MSAPLDGIRVVDLTRVLAGPFGSTILGDLGAEIIKVESLGQGDPVRDVAPYHNEQSHYFLSLNRNKKSIALDVKTEDGRRILAELVNGADVLLENFRPGVLTELGLDPDELLERRPGLIVCSISGFGQTGPLRDKASFDLVTQAMSGAMSVTGEPGRPPVRMGLPLGDLIGGLYGSIAVCAALHRRNETGRGEIIDMSLFDGLVSLLGYLGTRYTLTGESPGPVGSGHHYTVPYGAYAAKDGYIVIACMMDHFWPKLCEALGRPELGEDPRFEKFDDRGRHRELIDEEVGAAIATRTVAEWCEIFEQADVPHAPILNVEGVMNHPHTRARGMVQEYEHDAYGAFEAIGSPMKFREGEAPNDPPPLHGEHTDEVLAALGYDAAAIAELRTASVVE
jgi:crotonobetainyl-CoA:carnitine CoA-transferase CaiB-like acyl-CoA transferase